MACRIIRFPSKTISCNCSPTIKMQIRIIFRSRTCQNVRRLVLLVISDILLEIKLVMQTQDVSSTELCIRHYLMLNLLQHYKDLREKLNFKKKASHEQTETKHITCNVCGAISYLKCMDCNVIYCSSKCQVKVSLDSARIVEIFKLL
jgi:hypothetical protein